MRTIAERFKKTRKSIDYIKTQSEFASSIGISQASLAQIENGSTKNISNPVLMLLRLKYNINTDYITTGEGEMFLNTTSYNKPHASDNIIESDINELQRLKKVINWLVYSEYAENATDLAKKIGYNKSSLSQIVNGTTPLSSKFAEKISSTDEKINKEWLLTGEGEMLLNTLHEGSTDSHNQIGANSSNFMNNNISGAGNSVSYSSSTPSLPAVPAIKKNKSIVVDKTDNPYLSEIELLKQMVSERDRMIAQKDILIAEKERLINVLMR